MGSVDSSEGPWLQRFANGKPVRKPKRQQPWKVSDPQHSSAVGPAVESTGEQCLYWVLYWNWPPNPTEILPVFAGLCSQTSIPGMCLNSSVSPEQELCASVCPSSAHSEMGIEVVLLLTIPSQFVEHGWEHDLYKADCLFMQTFSFLYIYPEVLLITSRVAQPIILIAADILGRKILPKIG